MVFIWLCASLISLALAGPERQLAIINQWKCPKQCECDDNMSSTVCSRRNFKFIPNVPMSSMYVYFDRNIFANPVLTSENFTSIPYVRGLYLRGCGITRFDVDAFSNLKLLRELDLSHNKIESLPRNAFKSLQLEFLDLSYNSGIKLVPDAFCGAAISRLSLKCCDLTQIDVQTFHPLFDSITSLTLTCNDIETLPASMVWSPSHLTTLNFGDNFRMKCDCNLIWIYRRMALNK